MGLNVIVEFVLFVTSWGGWNEGFITVAEFILVGTRLYWDEWLSISSSELTAASAAASNEVVFDLFLRGETTASLKFKAVLLRDLIGSQKA